MKSARTVRITVAGGWDVDVNSGQSAGGETYEDETYFSDQPDWFSADKIEVSIDEAKADKDKMTVVSVLREAKDVEQGQIIELVTTFLPAPGIDVMKSKGYSVWPVKESDDLIKTYFLKNAD